MARNKKPAPAAEGESMYEVLSRLEHDCTIYEVGDSVALDAEAAAPLVTQRVIKPAAAEKPAT